MIKDMVTNFIKIKYISTFTHLTFEEEKVFTNNPLSYDKCQ